MMSVTSSSPRSEGLSVLITSNTDSSKIYAPAMAKFDVDDFGFSTISTILPSFKETTPNAEGSATLLSSILAPPLYEDAQADNESSNKLSPSITQINSPLQKGSAHA